MIDCVLLTLTQVWTGKKVKFRHSRYRALVPELIPVYRQSARRWLFKPSPAVGCRYFPPGLRSPSQPKNVTVRQPVPSCTAWWQRHIGVNNFPKVVMQLCPRGHWTYDLLIARPTPYRYATAPALRYTCSRPNITILYKHSQKSVVYFLDIWKKFWTNWVRICVIIALHFISPPCSNVLRWQQLTFIVMSRCIWQTSSKVAFCSPPSIFARMKLAASTQPVCIAISNTWR